MIITIGRIFKKSSLCVIECSGPFLLVVLPHRIIFKPDFLKGYPFGASRLCFTRGLSKTYTHVKYLINKSK